LEKGCFAVILNHSFFRLEFEHKKGLILDLVESFMAPDFIMLFLYDNIDKFVKIYLKYIVNL
jgi:hypothetical protein